MSAYDSLVDTLKDMGLVPTADLKEELESWMNENVETGVMVPSVKVERSKVTADKAESLHTHPPRLRSGNKGETTFDVWQYGVTCLLQDKTQPKEIVLQPIRRFLQGDTGGAAIVFGLRGDIENILHTLIT